MVFQIGLVVRLQLQRHVHTLLVQSRGSVPGVQGLLQKILLPGGHVLIQFAQLTIQWRVEIRRFFPTGLTILRRLCPVPDRKLPVGQLRVPEPCDHRRTVPIAGIAALAGGIVRISIGDGCLRTGRFTRQRLPFGRSPGASAQQQQCQKKRQNPLHRDSPFFKLRFFLVYHTLTGFSITAKLFSLLLFGPLSGIMQVSS